MSQLHSSVKVTSQTNRGRQMDKRNSIDRHTTPSLISQGGTKLELNKIIDKGERVRVE